MSITLDHPWVLLAGAALAVGAAGLVVQDRARRRRRLAQIGAPEALARLVPVDLSRLPMARAVRMAVAVLCIALALAGPRWGSATESVRSDGVDVVIALDASLSMLAEDERPNRLERAKQEVRRLRAMSPGDRFALIAFAGRSYVLSPLTADAGALDLFLETLDPGTVGQGGSALAPPLRQALDLLAVSRSEAGQGVVLLSDGEAFDDLGAAVDLATEARDAGVAIVTVGFGTADGGVIPLPGSGGAALKRDERGETVITRANAATLEQLARVAGGVFVPTAATDKATRIHGALAQLEAAAFEESLRASRPLRFQWFALVAVVLLLIDAFRIDGRRRAARIAAAVGLVLMPLPSSAQAPSLRSAVDHQRAGRLGEAIRIYRANIADGAATPAVLYNLGTALVMADSLDAAVEVLERALTGATGTLRRDIRYNLGLAYLTRGLRLEGEGREVALQGAKRAFRTLLLEQPGDADAQWNYELALRAPTGSGGGGGGGPSPSGSPEVPPPPQRRLSQQQAEALLDASAREERETRARRQRAESPIRGTGPDW